MRTLPELIRRFWHDHQLNFCACCNRPVFEKNTTWRRHLSGAIMPICRDCDRKIFTPFGG
jgi:RNase P subunit RPR2